MSWTRREVLSAASLLAAGCTRAPPSSVSIPGEYLEPDHRRGHLLREGSVAAAGEPRVLRVGVVIVGGGVAGLSAAWALKRSGFDDFRLLELENEVGGTARGAHTAGLLHPLGAHYVPQPSEESRAVRALFEELGIITGYAGGVPVYDETMLCQAPEHRLFQEGRWIDGNFPRIGMQDRDRAELELLQAALSSLREARDGEGRRAFAIPMAYSSPDPRWRSWDQRTMAAWLDELGVRSARVRWWVEYGLRDDYGTTLETTSAWAGLHYFCSRGLADPDVLTWPEGNGWLVERLRGKVAPCLSAGYLVHRIRPGVVEALGPEGPVRFVCDRVIVALPHYVAARVVEGLERVPELSYAPWLVANVHVEEPPPGAAWDNVFYDSSSLGYVVSTHQSLSVRPGPSVLTWFRPYTGADPVAARKALLEASREALLQEVLGDLERAHRGLRRMVTRVDLTRWGHGMVRPTPGLLFGAGKNALSDAEGPICYAHSDLSGLALFEEAQYRGVLAAERTLRALGQPYTSLL